MTDRPKQDPKSVFRRPGAATGTVDEESGNEGAPAEELARQLYALQVMRDRGLLPEADYQRRRAALEAEHDA